jgi:hypothetical protein
MNKSMMKKGGPMNRVSTYFLRAVVVVMGLVAALLCYLIIPELNDGWNHASPEIAGWRYPFTIALLGSTIPFCIALFQTWKLLGYVDNNKPFSKKSVRALRNIKYCGFVFSVLYVICLPVVYFVADNADAPGVMVIGLVMSFAPLVIAVFAAVLERLLQSAIDIKSENDLTV